MKSKSIKTILFIWTLLSFLIDLYVTITNGNYNYRLIIALIIIGTVVCWIAYQMMQGKKWALITMTVYYGILIINIYTDGFSFHTKSGINFAFGIGKIISINIISLFIFLILIVLLIPRTDNSSIEK
jgi:hypothetical protein